MTEAEAGSAFKCQRYPTPARPWQSIHSVMRQACLAMEQDEGASLTEKLNNKKSFTQLISDLKPFKTWDLDKT